MIDPGMSPVIKPEHNDKDYKELERKKIFNYKHIDNIQDIIDEISNILKRELPKDPEVISVFDVERVFGDYKRKKADLLLRYEDYLSQKVKKEYNDSLSVDLKSFNASINNNRFIIYLLNKNHESIRIFFEQKDDGLRLVESNNRYWATQVLSCLEADLIGFCNEYLKIHNSDKVPDYCTIKPVNSNFYVRICDDYLGIFTDNSYLNKNFGLVSKYCTGYEINADSINISIKKCKELFKRVYIWINDLPEWSQSIFREIRKNELLEQERQEELKRQQEILEQMRKEELKKQQLEAKEQRKLALKRIFMPWSKK